MSETRAPAQGQIETPNPLELFWEKHKRWVVGAATVAAVALLGNYAYTYYKQREVDRLWTRVMAATRLDRAYAEDGSLAGLLGNAQLSQQAAQAAGMYLQYSRGELATELQRDLKELEPKQLATELDAAKGTAAEPLLLWVKAVHAVLHEDWGTARATLDELEQRFPHHFLCVVSDYPPQFRPPLEEEADKDAETAPPKRGKPEEPKLEKPVPGSSVSLLRAQIDREDKFRQTQRSLYEPPVPDESPEVVIRFSPLDREIKIRFYSSAAPKHVENFLALVREGTFYKDQRIDEVQRAGSQSFLAEEQPRQFHFGLAASKENDRTKWDEAKGKPSGVVLDFEDSELSHFPGMVAAEPEPGSDGKSSGERVWITANDAVEYDGQRVIFGRVVEGLDVVEQICGLAFVEETMETSGRGKLQTNVTIESISIVGEAPQDEKPQDEKKEDGGGK